MGEQDNNIMFRIAFEAIQDGIDRLTQEQAAQREKMEKVVEVLQKIAVTEEKLATQTKTNADFELRIRALEDNKTRAKGWFDAVNLVWVLAGGAIVALIAKLFGG